MKLKNGLTVIMKEDHEHPIVVAQVWVKAGSVYENPKTYGLSHFLEHLIFKGTDKYPGDMISRAVETNGGNINAATSKEFTEYFIDIQKDASDQAVEILADAMANAAFPADEIEKERLVVLEEIKRHDDYPNGLLYDSFAEALHGATAYRNRVIGAEEVIRNVTRQEIIDYYKTYYVPNNMIFLLIGDFDTAKKLALIENTFGALTPGETQLEPQLAEAPHKPVSVRKGKDVEQMYWAGGFLGPDITGTQELMTADVTASILGGGRSSRLYRKVREEKQLVYSIGASYWSLKGNGTMVIPVVLEPSKEKAAVSEIKNTIDLLMKKGPDDKELKRTKQMLKSSWYFGLETYHGQAGQMAYWHLMGNPGFLDNYVQGIEAVSKQNVIDFLKKYYEPGLSEAALVPEKK